VFGQWRTDPPKQQAAMSFLVGGVKGAHPDLYLVPRASCAMTYINDPTYGQPKADGVKANCYLVSNEGSMLWSMSRVCVRVLVQPFPCPPTCLLARLHTCRRAPLSSLTCAHW
jgi:hypothetical protein